MSTQNALLTILVEKIKNDTLVLPTLPAVALKVRKAADDPDINLNQMGDVIGQDPSLSARMIKIANSAYMGRAVKVTSISQAVTRIGLRQIKNIATALAMEQLFVSKNELVGEYMKREWNNTVEVVANAMATLQLYVARTKNREMTIDTMTLTALVHNIGVLPILTEAERHEEVFASPTFLDDAIDKLAPRIGGSIMQSWGFGENFVTVAERWHDLAYIPEKLSYVDFVRVGAALAGQINNQKDAILNLAIQRGVVEDVNSLLSDEFAEMRSAAKQIFA
ncbi:MAG: HDOD domain-containing protein [Pseudomonadota bacterium]|jgi:HD-like signal output (HDOD) protein|uniref:HDOD domain-containing protein n=1 Tax=Marisediminitalea TaxID=2662254 RepID=UPI0020CE4DED|nr:HDOD domain-containing protein [Marisediminitalea aggregata]MCP3865863.1 HDOD domain-containing protein [Aestuariibacter sp.]MCP4274772.1 HDOD domain-containing protein [Gammaproteobacteria bacterium]MEC8228515.1 HDOD domain-containing protein [Pseudomonadota bacterium]MCP4234096.1 HDOD domain-containing protein [Aestuariibacter sp.]MCP4525951.1 HDOD domain-containing protein [Aestuariibacter sp.]|tara:strand:+ start:315 stop:1151 length:837 start_codon:yes stop_codon:yes gene_type:complete